MKLTAAQRRALEAVRNGNAFRTYTSKGNTIAVRSGTVAPISVYRLEALKLIRERAKSGKWSHTCGFELTDAGRKVLEP